MARDYKAFVKSMTTSECMDWIDYHFLKYRKMGYSVYHYRSSSCIMDAEDKTIVHNKLFNHELKTIDAMEEYLKNKK